MDQSAAMTVLEETPARFTVDEFMQLIEASPISDWMGKVELVEGIIVRMSPAHVPHWNAQRVTYDKLYQAMRGVPDWIVGQEPAVRLSGDTIREPDIALLRDPDLSRKVIDRTALFLAIEIADSSLPIDIGAKRRNYAEAFIPHYWVVDVNGREVRVMQDPMGGDYRTQASIPFGREIEIPGTDRTIVID